MLKPKFRFNRITDVSGEFLKEAGIKNIILDIDNTLTYHDSQEISEGVLNWLSERKEEGIGLVLLSNNNYDRVRPFAERIGLEFVPSAAKPLTKGYNRLLSRFNWNKKETASIGDQLFTDMLGANLSGVKSILVEPFHKESGKFLRFKRVIEELILKEKRNYD